jgi:hypothetical protein
LTDSIELVQLLDVDLDNLVRGRSKNFPAPHADGVTWLGHECGVDEWSHKPSTPSTANRSIHFATVSGVVLK